MFANDILRKLLYLLFLFLNPLLVHYTIIEISGRKIDKIIVKENNHLFIFIFIIIHILRNVYSFPKLLNIQYKFTESVNIIYKT